MLSQKRWIPLLALGFAISNSCLAVGAEQPKLWWKLGLMADQMAAKVPTESIKYYKEAIEEAKAANQPNKVIVSQIYYLGLAQFHERQLADAISTYKTGVELSEKNGLKDWQAAFLSKIGHTEKLQNDWGQVDKMDPAPLIKALELKPGNPLIPTEFHASCYESLGNIYRANKDYVNAEKYIKLALAECEQLGDEDYRVASLTCSLSILRLQQKQPAEAVALLIEASKMHPSMTGEFFQRYSTQISKSDASASDVGKTARELFNAHKYAELDKLAEKLRASGETTPMGFFRINDIYDSCGIDDETEMGAKKRIEEVRDWIKKDPKSATAKILLASILTDFAWKARGSGYANTVSKDGWKLMADRLNEAWSTLKQVNQRPPEWYPYALHVALGQGWSQPEYDVVFNESRKRFPNYDQVIFSKAYWLQPKWHGEPGDAEKLIANELKNRSGVEGDVLYARVMQYIDGVTMGMLDKPDFDWPRMKRGFSEIAKRYPKSERVKVTLMKYALQVNDKATLQSMGVKTK